MRPVCPSDDIRQYLIAKSCSPYIVIKVPRVNMSSMIAQASIFTSVGANGRAVLRNSNEQDENHIKLFRRSVHDPFSES